MPSKPPLLILALTLSSLAISSPAHAFTNHPKPKPGSSHSPSGEANPKTVVAGTDERVEIVIEKISVKQQTPPPASFPSKFQTQALTGPIIDTATSIVTQLLQFAYTEVIANPLDEYLDKYGSNIAAVTSFADSEKFNADGYFFKVLRSAKNKTTGQWTVTHTLTFLLYPQENRKDLSRIIPISLEIDGPKAKGAPTNLVVSIKITPPPSAGKDDKSEVLTYDSGLIKLGDWNGGKKMSIDFNEDTIQIKDGKPVIITDVAGKVDQDTTTKCKTNLIGSQLYLTPKTGAFDVSVNITESNEAAKKFKDRLDKFKADDISKSAATALVNLLNQAGAKSK